MAIDFNGKPIGRDGQEEDGGQEIGSVSAPGFNAEDLENVYKLSRQRWLDAEMMRFASSRDARDEEKAFAYLDNYTRERWGIVADRGNVWTPGRQPFANARQYADALVGILNRGYSAIASDRWKEWQKAVATGSRDEMIRVAGVRTEEGSGGLMFGMTPHMRKRTDEEIDADLNEYAAKVQGENFVGIFNAIANDPENPFTDADKEIVQAALRHGDGLPPEKEADFASVLTADPEKGYRIYRLIDMTRRRESRWFRDNMWDPFWTHGTVRLFGNAAKAITEASEDTIREGAFYETVSQSGDSGKYYWNDDEKAEYKRLLEHRPPSPSAAVDPAYADAYPAASDEEVKAMVDRRCARRLADLARPKAERLRQRREELVIEDALSHKPTEEYGYLSRSVAGFMSTIPYMGVSAATMGVGFAVNTLAQFQTIRDEVLLQGGDPETATGLQLGLAVAWSAIEKAQLNTAFGKPLTGLQKKVIAARIAQTAWRNGKLKAIGSLTGAYGKELLATTIAESAEEALQGGIEGGTKTALLTHDAQKTLVAAVKQGAQDFYESLGTMGIIGVLGAGKKAVYSHRAATDAESLSDYAARKMQVMNMLRGESINPDIDANAPKRVQQGMKDLVDIWRNAPNHAAALEQISEKYAFDEEQTRNVADYLDLRDALLREAETDASPKRAERLAGLAGNAFPVGRPGMHFDPQQFAEMLPGATIEDVEVPDTSKPAIQPEYTPEQLAAVEEAKAAQEAINNAKVGSERRRAERQLRKAKKKLDKANANAPAPVQPTRKTRRITLASGASFLVDTDETPVDIHSASYGQSVRDAMAQEVGKEYFKDMGPMRDGATISMDDFMAMTEEERQNVVPTAEQWLKMGEEERQNYVVNHHLSSGGDMNLIGADGRKLFGADAIVRIKRGIVNLKSGNVGGNWELAHETGHVVSQLAVENWQRAIDEAKTPEERAAAEKAMADGIEAMRRLFGDATGENERWNEEQLGNQLAEWLRGKHDFRQLTPEERREKMSIFRQIWEAIKAFFGLTREQAPIAPVEADEREQARQAAFEAAIKGDLTGMGVYAGIDFAEDEKPTEKPAPAPEASEAPSAKPISARKPPETPETAAAPSATAEGTPTTPETPSAPSAAPAAPAASTVTAEAPAASIPAEPASAASVPVRANLKRTIFTPDYSMQVEADVMWVPLASLVESTDDREVQMRDRSRAATDEQVLSKTRKGVFQPLALMPGSKSDDGAPIVGGGMRIISGHGRKRMLDQLAKEGRFNSDYLAAINAECRRQGIPTAPEGMENPVLVSRVTGGLANHEALARFAELSNRWGGLERSGAEHAESDARKITPALLRLYNPDASGNLLAASNRPFMSAFLKEVGATGLTNKDGTPTAEAALRVQRAMMAAIFGNDEKVRDMVQNLMERSGELSLASLQNALMRSAGKLLAMKRQKGSFDIVEDVREAAYQYIAWRAAQKKNSKLTLADHLNQSDFFTAAVPALQQALARLLEVDRFGTVLDKYAELVAQEAVDEQATFGFFEKHTPLQLLGLAERALIAEGETPVTPDPASAEAAAPVQTPPAVQQEDAAPATSAPTATDPLDAAQQVITPKPPATFTPVPVKRGTATLPGPGSAQFPASQVNAEGQPTTKVRMLPPGAWNLLRPAYDTGRPPAPSAQDKAGRGLGIASPAPTGHADIFPHFQGNKTDMAARTSQAIRNTMSEAERAHYTTIVDYFGGGGCWGLYHALENFPNVRQLVVNEFDPDRVRKIQLLHDIDGQVADEAEALLKPHLERLSEAAGNSSSPVTIANKVEALLKREITDEHQRAVLQAFIDCAKTMLATSKDADGNPINDTTLGIDRALDALREDGRKAKAAADEFKARGGRISYRSGDAASFDDAPHGDQVMAVTDPPYYLTADYQQNTILGLDEVPDNWSYRATQKLLHKLVDNGDGILYTDEAWWFKEGYVPDQQEDLFRGGSTFQKEQDVLLDIINTLDHFDVAGRVVGRQEVLGVHHGHTTDRQTANGANGDAARPDTADNEGRTGSPSAQPVLGMAAVAEGQGGNDGTAGEERGRAGAGTAAGRAGAAGGDSAAGSGADGATPGPGSRALAREVIVQHAAASVEEASQGSDPAAVDALVRHSVRQVREERMADYARTVAKNAKRWLATAARRLDERMTAAGFTEKVWHGTYGEDFSVFRFTSGNHEVPAAYFTYNRGTAQNYAAMTGMLEEDDDASDAKYNTRQFYINPGKRYEHDERKNPTTLAEFKQLLADLYAQGYNSVLVRHAIDDQGARLDEFDNGPMTFLEPDEMPGDGEGDFETDILIVMQQPGDNAAARIKAADPVTFFEDGLPIPLEMRADQTMQDVRYSVTMGKNAREEARRTIEKYRPDLVEAEAKSKAWINQNQREEWAAAPELIDAAVDNIAAFETPKERKAALLWFCKKTILLPEDAPKVTEAIKTAERAKVDPMQFERPGEILTRYADYRPKEPRINPDTVPELTDKRELKDGITTYLVQDDKAGQAAMRRIIDTHWGKDANPWCLLQGDGKGNLSDNAWHYWQHYSALPKRVAFKDGKLIAFMATDTRQELSSQSTARYYALVSSYETESGKKAHDEWGNYTDEFESWYNDGNHYSQQWWDRQDESHDGIPYERTTTDNGAKTTETVKLMPDGKENVIKRTSTAADGTEVSESWNSRMGYNRYMRSIRTADGASASETVDGNGRWTAQAFPKEGNGNYDAIWFQTIISDGNATHRAMWSGTGDTRAEARHYSEAEAKAVFAAVEAAIRRGDPIPPPPAERHSVQARPMTAVEIARAVEYFGTTEDPKNAAFILPDGRWLDYEQMGEHWEISQAFNAAHMKQLDALLEFEGDAAPYVDAALNAGLVRVTGGVFDTQGNPTEIGLQTAIAPDASIARNMIDYVDAAVERYPTLRTFTLESYAAPGFARQYDLGDPRAVAQIKRDINQIKSATDNNGDFSGDNDVRFSVVRDPALLQRLESEPTVKAYRAMQMVDGKLYPPMAAKLDGEWQTPAELGEWIQAEERPDLVKDGKFVLNKGNGSSITAAYNPYWHTSRSPLNDQFSSAYKRPNLVTVEVEVPASELTSGYKAEGAKDAVGEMDWHSGPVSSKLAKLGNSRRVILSRWCKPVRVVPDAEVADTIAQMLDGTDITIPANVVTPSLRAELEQRNVPIADTTRHSVLSSGRYYGTGLREIAHGLKRGDEASIAQAADLMAANVPPNAVLVPMPGHEGPATTMLPLAQAIAARVNGATVVDALVAEPHESNYSHKKRMHRPVKVTMHRTDAKLPNGRPVLVVDNVIASGATYRAAQAVIPDADLLTLADAGRGRETPGHRERMRHSVFMGERGAILSNTGNDRLHVAAEMLRKARGKYTPKVRDEIYKKTGWWKGTDGEWRIEIPDMKPKTLDELPAAVINGEAAYAVPLTDLVSNGRLFKAYPELKNATVWVLNPDSDAMDGIAGSFDGRDIMIDFDAFANIDPADGVIVLNYEGLQTLTHEVQHFVQYIESFAAGGSVKQLGVRKYTRLAGEVEARNAERRVGGPYGTLTNPRFQNEANWTDMVKYGNAPWQTEDVPTIDQLLYDRNGAVNSRAWFDAHPGRQAKHGGWINESQSARSSVVSRRPAGGMRMSDIVAANAAARILAGKEVKAEDIDKIVRNAGIRGTTAADILNRAHALADRNRQRIRGRVERSDPKFVRHLAAQMMGDRLTSALDAAIAGGASAADPDTGMKIAQAIQSKQTRDLMAAHGFDAAQMMAELPIDLAEAVFAVAEYEKSPEEMARLEEARREREAERAAEQAEADAEGITVEELRARKQAEADADTTYRDPTDEERAAFDELMDRARFADEARRAEEERKRREQAKREEAERAAAAESEEDKEGGEDEAEGEEGSGSDTEATSTLPVETLRRIAPVFESAELFAQFIVEWTADHVVAKHPEMQSTAQMWKNPVAVRELKQTATHILRQLAKDTLGSPSLNYARNFADHAINELESDAEYRTFNSVRRKIAKIYDQIHDNALRISRRKQVKELIKQIRRTAGARGRFSAITEEMQRTIDGKTELWARRLIPFLTMSEEKLSAEIDRLRAIVEGDPTNPDTTPHTPDEVAEAADKLALANKYGGMVRWMPGKIADAAAEIMEQLNGKRQAFEQKRELRKARLQTIRDAFVNAMENGASEEFRGKEGAISRYLNAMQGNLTLEMQNLIRFCRDENLRQAALEAIEELQTELSEATGRYRVVMGEAQRELRQGLASIYGSAEKGMKHLLSEELPDDAAKAIFNQGRNARPTYGQLLQLYASTIQHDYRENAEQHGRTAQLALMEATLTDQDRQFHAWAVEWFKRNRQTLSDAVEEVTGLPVTSPDDRYTPVRVQHETDGFSVDALAWSPVPSALNRRVRHNLDFDERVNFLSILQEQAEVRAQTIGYSAVGILFRDTLASREVQAAARKHVGASDIKNVTDHVRDVLVQGAARNDASAFFAPLNTARAWMARFYLSGNIPSAIKQLASMPVWANAMLGGKVVGLSGVARYFATVGTEEGRQAIRELMDSDGYKARYVMGWSEETQNVLQNPSRSAMLSAIGKIYDKGLIVNKFVDGVSCLWMAQGFYRDATAHFLAKGMDEAEAKRKAIALTWSVLESGQQSGRVENMNRLQRDRGMGGSVVKALFQFKTAWLLQNNYLFQALRDWRAGVPGAKGRALRALVINNLYIPAFVMAVNALRDALLGDDPPDEDPDKWPTWFKELGWSMVDGTTAPMFGVSLAAHALYDAATDSKGAYAQNAGLPAVEGAIRIMRRAGEVIYDIGHGVLERVTPFDFEEEITAEKLGKDVDRLLRDLAAPYRHASKAYHNYTED